MISHKPDRKCMVRLTSVMYVGSALLLAACGASSETPNSVASSPTAASSLSSISQSSQNQPAATETRGPAPDLRDAVVICSPLGGLAFVDPVSGETLRTTPDLPESSTKVSFASTGGRGGSTRCGNGTYNSDFSRISGIARNGTSYDFLPAFYDTTTQEVVLIGNFPDRSGFGIEPDLPNVLDCAFDPLSNDLWYATEVAKSGEVLVTGPNYSKKYKVDGDGHDFEVSYKFDFVASGRPPEMTGGDGTVLRDGQVVTLPTGTSAPDPRYLDPNKLPKTDLSITDIRLSDDRRSAAFIAFDTQTDLWMVPAIGGAPHKVGTVGRKYAGVVRIGRFPI